MEKLLLPCLLIGFHALPKPVVEPLVESFKNNLVLSFTTSSTRQVHSQIGLIRVYDFLNVRGFFHGKSQDPFPWWRGQKRANVLLSTGQETALGLNSVNNEYN